MIENKIIVYIINQQDNINDKTNDKTNDIKNLFKDFQVNIVDIEIPKDLSYPTTLSKDDMKEIYRFIWCLNDSRKMYGKRHVLTIKNDSIPKISSTDMKELIDEILKNTYDLTYLSTWNNKDSYKNDNKVLVKSNPSNSSQALLIHPKCRDKLLGLVSLSNSDKIKDYNVRLPLFLNNLISNNNISALAIVPSPFEIKRETKDNDKPLLLKKSCNNKNNNNNNNNSKCVKQNKDYTYLYIILGAFLALIITIVIILLIKKRK
jgi:hypothetical protein